ncbi:MAG: flagellar hook-length control protein FliK, partial [Pseudomonadota bacterium]
PHQPRHVEPKQVIDQISVQIAKQAKDGADTIKVQLKPVDLGRIEIKLEVQDGRVQAHVTADSKDTLALLQKDARGLEKALQDAGLKTEGQMTFSLAGDGQQAQGGNQANQNGARRRSRLAAAAAAGSNDNATAAEAPRTGRRSGVDIKV